jgi:predicted RNA-binding Zn-ribbon protein involved in translation (DUF1610 family)
MQGPAAGGHPGGRPFTFSGDDTEMGTDVVHPHARFRAFGALIRVAGGLHESDGVVTNGECKESAMQGHIRSRGKRSFEYIVDVGTAQAQRCQSCGRRYWVERKLKDACPACGGRLSETEERRRETKAGFHTRKEAQAAMAKVLVSVEEHSHVVPSKVSVREYLSKEWLPSIEATIRATAYRSYVQHVECHICPHIGSVKLEKLSGATINSLYAKLAQSGKRNGKSGLSALSIRHVHAVLHRALKDAVRWGRLSRMRKAMLPEIRLHDLRHTHATLALRAGIHPKVVSERLGHATVSITLDTYSHAIPAMQEEAAARIAELVLAAR